MEKVDRAVALVGALVLVVGVAVAATQEEGTGVEYAVAYASIPFVIPTFEFPSALPTTGTDLEAGFSVGGNVSLIMVNFTVTALSATEGSVRAALQGDNGTVLAEQEATVPAGSRTPVALSLSALVAPVPVAPDSTFPSEEAARAALVAGNGTSQYRVVFSYSPGLTPAAQANLESTAIAVLWTGVVFPVAPESR